MKVRELVKKLLKVNQDLEVQIDADEVGFFTLEKVKVLEVDNDEFVLNLKSSNEL